MKKYIFLILLLLFIALLALLWWRYVPLTDGDYVVSNKHIAWHMTVSNGVLQTQYIENKDTGDRLKVQGDDFILRMGHADTIRYVMKNVNGRKTYPYIIENGIDITPANCRAIKMIRGWRKRKICLYNPALNCNIYLEFNYDNTQLWLRRNIKLQACNAADRLSIDEARHIRWDIESPEQQKRQGQPVLIDTRWFAALEHPISSNYVEGSTLVLEQFPGYTFSTEPITLQSMVIGTSVPGNILSVFNQYLNTIRRPARSICLYNTWCDLRGKRLYGENIRSAAEKIKKRLTEYGNPLEIITIDDGWQNTESIWLEDSDKFPDGLSNTFSHIQSLGFKNGLWLPLSGKMLDIEWGSRHGYEAASKSFFCLSGSNYNKALTLRIQNLLTQNDIDFFKHDFNYFRCGRYQHGHFAGELRSKEVNVDKLLSLLKLEARLNTNIFLAITSGIWPSPWWLQYADTIWMGGKDHNSDTKKPVTRGSLFEMNYRDVALYDMLIRNNTVFPLSALMTHGVVDGRHTVYEIKEEDDEGWANYVMNYLGRGTMMREFYITPDNITPLRWEIMARGIRWAKSLDDCMSGASFFLGDPGKGELFGYTGTHKNRRYVSVRNPRLSSATVSLSQLLLTNGICRVVYPYHAVLKSQADEKLLLPGESVLQAESFPEEQLPRPVPVGVRAQVVAASEESTEYIVSPEPGQTTCILRSPVKIRNVESDTVTASAGGEGEWTLTFNEQKEYTEPATIISTDFSSNGILSCVLSVASNTQCNVQIIDHNGTFPHTCTVNGTQAAMATLAGEGWRVSQVTCAAGLNLIKSGFQFASSKKQALDMEILLQVNTTLPEYRILINHDPLPHYDRFDMPFPILQTTQRKTLPLISRRTVKLDTSSGRLYAERKLTEQQLQAVTGAKITMDIFDVNSGKYDNKRVFLNNTFIGKLPVSPEPRAKWHTVAMPVGKNLLSQLQLDNVFTIKDTTDDQYKIRNIRLQVAGSDGKTIDTYNDAAIYSTSLQWQYGEGKILSRNGSPVTVLSF